MASAIFTPTGSKIVTNHRNAYLPDAVETNSPGSAKKLKTIVIIPCYNEEIAIGSIVLRSRPYSDEVVVVDDGSQDKTSEVARLAGARVIRHDTNKGKGAGIRSAFRHAKNAGADILVLLDGDGQHNPDEIPLLVKPIRRGEADIVNGSRFLVKDSHNVPGYRRIGQEVLTLLTNVASGQKITDSQSGFRAFSRKTFDSFSFVQAGMGIESEMLIEAIKSRLRIKEIQINVRYDVAGSTLNPFVHGFTVAWSLVRKIFRENFVPS